MVANDILFFKREMEIKRRKLVFISTHAFNFLSSSVLIVRFITHVNVYRELLWQKYPEIYYDVQASVQQN